MNHHPCEEEIILHYYRIQSCQTSSCLPHGNHKGEKMPTRRRRIIISTTRSTTMIVVVYACLVLLATLHVAHGDPSYPYTRRKHDYNDIMHWRPTVLPSNNNAVIQTLLFQGAPETPAAVLEPWYRRIQDPHPSIPVPELETFCSDQEIDEVINQVVGSEPGIVIQRFRPYPRWLWRQWFGTVLFHTAGNVLVNMGIALIFCFIVQYRSFGNWNIFKVLPAEASFPRLEAIDKIWKTLMSLATFLLTFFVGQAYTFWRSIYDQARGVQGRLNDINMLLAANGAPATKSWTSNNNNNNSKEYYTEEALDFLNRIAAKLRVCHLLFWAANSPSFRVLLTQRGLDRLVQVGYLPPSLKAEVLDATHGLGPTEKWYAMLESALMDCQLSLRNPKTINKYSTALDMSMQDLFCRLRAHLATIPDLVDGRMPLAYAHFVQILVDLFLMVAPVAQYPEMGVFCVVLVGILTLFYRGLLDLAKVFLDPLDMEDYCEGAVHLNLGVFIREANGASMRWMLAGRAAVMAGTTEDYDVATAA